MLGETEVKPDGSFDVAFLIPANMPAGNHTLQINGVTANNEVVTQTMGVLVEAKTPTLEPAQPAAIKKVIFNFALTTRQNVPTKQQIAKVAKFAKSVSTGSVVTCKSFVTIKPATKTQITQANKIANTLCAPLVKNNAVKVKFNRIAPRNAASLTSAKSKPIRVRIWVKSPAN